MRTGSKRSVSSLQNLRQKLKTYAPMSLKGWLVYLLAMLIASLVCIMLQQVSTSDVHVPIIFVLVVLVVSLLGAFSINKNVFDVGVCVLFGVIGWLMNKYEFPLSPILLALILGPMCEQNFVRFMDLNQGNFGEIIHYPIAVGFFVVAVGVVIFSIFNQRKINKREAEALAASGVEEVSFAQE